MANTRAEITVEWCSGLDESAERALLEDKFSWADSVEIEVEKQ